MFKSLNRCFLFLFFPLLCVYAENFECIADRVLTSFSENGQPLITTLEGNIKIVSDNNITIKCNKAIINHISGEIQVETDLIFSRDNLNITSGNLTYNMQKHSGVFVKNRFFYAPFYGSSETIKTEENKMIARNSMITTCDKENPHYRFFCDDIQISSDNVAMKGLKIYLGNTPIFYLPGYSYNIKTKKSPFQLSSGYKTELGNGITFSFNNSSKDSKLNISKKLEIGTKGLGAGIKIEDNTTYDTHAFKNNLSSYGFKKYEDSGMDYGFLGEFQHEFHNRQNIIIDWRWMKNEEFFKDHLYDDFLKKSKNPNYFSYTKILGQGSFGINIVDNAEEDFLSPEQIPEIEFSIPYVPMGDWFGSFQISPTKFIDASGNEYSRITSDMEFDRPFIAGYSKITPFIHFRNNYYIQQRDELNNFVSSAGVNVNFLTKKQNKDTTTFFSPTFSIFSNFPSEKRVLFSSDLYDFNPDGTFASMNLSWDFWKDNIHKGSLTSLIFYDIEESAFQDNIVMFDFALDKTWSFRCQERFNPSDGGMRQMSNTVLFKKNDVSIELGNRYLSGYFDGITAGFNRKFGDWEFGMSVDYDTKEEKFTYQRYLIQKQIHCFTIGIRYSKDSTTSIGFFVMPSVFAESRF